MCPDGCVLVLTPAEEEGLVCGEVLVNGISCTFPSTMAILFGRRYGTRPFSDGGFDFEWDQKSPMKGKVEHISDIEGVRRVEREAEKMANDGVHRPIAFRDYSQNSSNRDTPLFGKREFPKFSTRSKAGVPFVTTVSDFTEADAASGEDE